MDEYIRRQAAIEALENKAHLEWVYLRNLIPFLKTLEAIPAEDVVPVVRCKDCKYHTYDEIFCCYWCEYPGMVRETTPDGFCDKGEG